MLALTPARVAGGRNTTDVLVVGTTRDTPTAQLQAGQAVQRIVLSAATAGRSGRSRWAPAADVTVTRYEGRSK